MAFQEVIIIGLTGPIAGGKGVVAEFLRKKGFFYSSTSEFLSYWCDGTASFTISTGDVASARI